MIDTPGLSISATSINSMVTLLRILTFQMLLGLFKRKLLVCISSTTPREPTRPSASYPSPSKAVSRHLYTITSIVCHSQAVKKSNFLVSALALYLVGSGTKRRVVETLSGLGICHSYHQANRMMNRIARESEVRIGFSTNS